MPSPVVGIGNGLCSEFFSMQTKPHVSASRRQAIHCCVLFLCPVANRGARVDVAQQAHRGIGGPRDKTCEFGWFASSCRSRLSSPVLC